MRGNRILSGLLALFSVAETVIAVSMLGPAGGPLQESPGGVLGVFWQFSGQLSVTGWACAGLSIVGSRYLRRSQVRRLFAQKGFDKYVYDLMIGMRGGGSRLALLRSMDEPKHRQELAEITGIDWKEVDRQISVLEKYGLVKIYAQSGSVKMYQVTEQGRLLMKVIADLQPARSTW